MDKISRFRPIFQKYLVLIYISILWSCNENNTTKNVDKADKPENRFYDGIGVGPVNEIKLDSINLSIAAEGEELFQSKCISCHQLSDERKIGPGLYGITLRRRPEWIMNQMLNPLEMAKSDSLSKELLAIYLTQMVPMDLSYDEARKVLEFLRKRDNEN